MGYFNLFHPLVLFSRLFQVQIVIYVVINKP